MKHLYHLLLIFSFLFTTATSHGQILDKLGKKMEKKIEERANRKIDNAMEKTLDKTEEEIDESVKKKPKTEDEEEVNYEKNSNETPTEPSSGGLLGAFGQNVDVEDSYSFDLNIGYKMITESEKETIQIDYVFSLPENNTEYMMMEMISITEDGKEEKMPESGQMIFDNKNEAMVIIMEEQKMYMPMSMKREDLFDEADTESEDLLTASNDFTVNKTGSTKSILGYSCEEYQMESEDAVGSIWVTNDSRLKNFDPFAAMAGMAKNNKKNPQVMDIRGAVLEMDMKMKNVEKKGDPHSVVYLVTDISKKNFTKSLAGYSNPMSFQK